MRARIGAVAFGLAVAALTAVGRAADAFTVTDLGAVNLDRAVVWKAHASGALVGDRYPEGDDNGTIAWLFRNGVATDLGSLGGPVSHATAVNGSGQVTGYSMTPNNAGAHAFLYSGGTTVDLGTLGGVTSAGQAINAAGQVAGESQTADYDTHAFLYSGGVMSDLGTLGGTSSYATGINDRGQVFGRSRTAEGDEHAFLYDGGRMIDLNAEGLPGSAELMNDVGQIVGHVGYALYIYSDGRALDLSRLGPVDGYSTIPVGLNNRGDVVGMAYTLHDFRMFLYRDGEMLNLSELLAPTGWSIGMFSSIDDAGRIVGLGMNAARETHLIMLTPVPEPSVLTCAAGAIGCLAVRRLGRRIACGGLSGR